MEITAGFYKQNEELNWEYAPNFVYAPDYILVKEEKDKYTYPIGGWNWYDEQPEGYSIPTTPNPEILP
jgi:hypothetical protein